MKPIIPFVVFAIFLNINSIAQVNTANSKTKKPQQINKKMTTSTNPYFNKTSKEKINISEQEWEKNLSPALFEIARKKGTERAYTGKYDNFFDKGLKFRSMILPDLFIDQDTPEKMYETAGLDSNSIANKIKETLNSNIILAKNKSKIST